MEPTLKGKKIAVLVESQYIPGELNAYRKCFGAAGAEVHFMSRLWGQPKQTFVGEMENAGEQPETFEVTIDFDAVKLEDYAAVLIAANYVSVRLRYFDPPAGQTVTPSMARTAPAVQFFARAMADPRIVKGALCHGLWLLTPVPELLRGRTVICHEVVLADVVNAGAVYQWDASKVVVDRDLVTGHDWHVVDEYCRRIIDLIR
ncbi:MAG: DJ-1/PfpI family protein [Tepidisphaeraceae bacterium]